MLTQGDLFWDVIAVAREADLSRLPSSRSDSLSDLYQELSQDAAKHLAHATLGLQAVQAGSLRFLQRTTPLTKTAGTSLDLGEIEESLREAIPNCVFEHLDNAEYGFTLGLPCATASGLPIPMSELVASYAVMFFLSSIVRYHPDYMDKIAESPEAWLIESYAKSAPLWLLRELVALGLGHALIIQHA